MTIRISNPYREMVHVKLMTQNGTVDGVHVQPGATCSLPGNTTVHPNTMANHPRLRVTDDAAVGGPVPPAPVATGNTKTKG